MSDREKIIERKIFQAVARYGLASGNSFSVHHLFDDLFKSNGLLNSEAFIGGRLVNHDELRLVLRKMEAEGWVQHGFSYFKLTDAGIIELQKRLQDGAEFALTSEQLDNLRWSRLKAIELSEENANVVTSLIDKSLAELQKQKISNEEHRQAAAYMLAAKELVLAPSPPSEIIWDLIQKASAIAGIVQIVLQIFSALT